MHTENCFSEIGTTAIEKGLADETLSRFYENVQSAAQDGDLKGLRPFLPYLSLCSDKISGSAPPPIFYVGQKSSQRALFGSTWASPGALNDCLRTPDHELEAASADAYHKALGGTPYYGFARTVVDTGHRKVEVAFERFIVALKPSPNADYRFCAYFGVIQDLHRRN